MDADILSTGSGSSQRFQHRRRSSTSDAAKFKEKLQQLSHSVEMQEHLVAESPGEEGDGCETGQGSSGSSQQRSGDNDVSHVKSAWSKSNSGSDPKTPNTGEAGKEGPARKGVLNLTAANEGDKGSRDSRDSTMATSVLNVGFDL